MEADDAKVEKEIGDPEETGEKQEENLEKPEENLEKPEEKLEENPERTEEPEKLFEEEGKIFENNEKVLENPTEAIENPSDPIENPSEPIENPSEPIENPSEPIENPSESIENPEIELSSNVIAEFKAENTREPRLFTENSECKTVFVSLKSPTNVSLKAQSLNEDLFERLKQKDALKVTQINNYRLKQKANQIEEAKFIPKINPKSRKIIENKLEAKVKGCATLDSDDDTLYNYIPDSPRSVQKKGKQAPTKKNFETAAKNCEKNSENSEKKSKNGVDLKKNEQKSKNDEPTKKKFARFPEMPKEEKNVNKKAKKEKKFDGTSIELLKSAMKLRENLKDAVVPEVPLSKLSFEARAKLTESKKAALFESSQKLKKDNELQGCTFKPELISKVQPSVNVSMKHSKSEVMIEKKPLEPQLSITDFSYRIPAPGGVIQFHGKKQRRVMATPLVTEKYSQITPFAQPIRYKTGYNAAEILAKGQLMVNYNLED